MVAIPRIRQNFAKRHGGRYARDTRTTVSMKYVMGALKTQSIVNYAIRKRYLRRRLRHSATIDDRNTSPRLCNILAQFRYTWRMTADKIEHFGGGRNFISLRGIGLFAWRLFLPGSSGCIATDSQGCSLFRRSGRSPRTNVSFFLFINKTAEVADAYDSVEDFSNRSAGRTREDDV